MFHGDGSATIDNSISNPKRQNNSCDAGEPCLKRLSLPEEKALESVKTEPYMTSETSDHSQIAFGNKGFCSQYLPPSFSEHTSSDATFSDSQPFSTINSTDTPYDVVPNTRQEPAFSLQDRLKIIDELAEVNKLAAELLKIETVLADELLKLDFDVKVSHIYNPVDYAYKPHFEYYRKFCQSSAEVIMIGLNPGPFGMSQTGVSILLILLCT